MNPITPMSDPNTLTVLAVDDDALVLMSTCAMIEELGHTALEAFSGKDALRILEEVVDVDLVITDQAMPGMSGVELAQALNQQRPNLPIVIATGYSDLPPGSPDYPMIAKPFGEKELARLILKVLGARNNA
ncbi:MAG: response regulator [Beijerinckiaceae bacterium]|nr:response regulator [Beijerinckiaceae bacterium]